MEPSTSASTIVINENSKALANFVNAIRSPATKTVYLNSLRRYMRHIKITNIEDLLTNTNREPRIIEANLIDYIMSLRNDDISYDTIKYLVAPVFTFYVRNDVLLINRKKVFDYLPERLDHRRRCICW
jgi:hypothetical protein